MRCPGVPEPSQGWFFLLQNASDEKPPRQIKKPTGYHVENKAYSYYLLPEALMAKGSYCADHKAHAIERLMQK